MSTETKEQLDIAYNEKILEGPIKEGLILRRDPYSDILLTTQHLNELRRRLYELFCNWVLDETVYEDNTWSRPRIVEHEASQEALLEKYSDISLWMDKELSGSTHPAFSNLAQTFADEVQEICYSVALEIFVTDVPPDEENEWRCSTLFDSSVMYLEEALLTFCRSISTAEAWDFGKKVTCENRAIEQAKQKVHQQKYAEAREIAVKFIQLNCSSLQKLDLSLKDKSWVPTLKEATCYATDQELDALKLVGYPLHLSNNAANLIQAFLDERIEERNKKLLKN